MKTDWDNAKRKQTLDERGLDFADVQFLDWDTALTARDDRFDYGEDRFVTIGYMGERLCVVVWTFRADTLWVISLRKANKREINRYEKA